MTKYNPNHEADKPFNATTNFSETCSFADDMESDASDDGDESDDSDDSED